jgi:hypothetical protein
VARNDNIIPFPGAEDWHAGGALENALENAQAQEDAEAAIAILERAKRQFETASGIGPDALPEEDLWYDARARDYVRICVLYGDVLWQLGQHDEAIGMLHYVLDIAPSDGGAARYLLFQWLFLTDRLKELEVLLDEYDSEVDPWALYTRALLEFVLGGESDEAVDALARAVDANPYVPSYLLGEAVLPQKLPESYTPAGNDAAILYVWDAWSCWRRPVGILPWLDRETRELRLAPDDPGVSTEPIAIPPWLGDIGPERLDALTTGSMADADSVVRLQDRLDESALGDPAALDRVPLLRDALVLLRLLEAEEPLKATQKGFLPRRLVQRFWEEREKDRVEAMFRPYKEFDDNRGHRIRLCAEHAGLMKKHRGAFSLTRRGRQLLGDERLGSIYGLLFRASTEKVRWDAFTGGQNVPEIQWAFPAGLLLFHRRARGGERADQLVHDFLPVLELLRSLELDRDHDLTRADHLVRIQLIDRFGFELGLLEVADGAQQGAQRKDEAHDHGKRSVQPTALFDALFEWQL